MGFPGGALIKNLPANAEDIRDAGSIPGSGTFPWSKKWQPTLVFLHENFMDRGACPAAVNGVVKSWI